MKRFLLPLIPALLILTASCSSPEPPAPTPEPILDTVLEGLPAGEVVDIDGNSYPALQIGDQVWMGSNLMVTHGPDGEPVDYFCYNDDEENCQIYGRLYSLDAAMQGGSGEGAQGICPDGWHIPSMSEWEILIDQLGGRSTAGRALKEPGGDHWQTASPEAGGESGMDILPSGWFDFTLEYRGLGQGCFLRTSSAPNPSYALIWMLESNSAGIEKGDLHPDDAIPLRCLKD